MLAGSLPFPPWGRAACFSWFPGANHPSPLLSGYPVDTQAGRGKIGEVYNGSGHRLINGHDCCENFRLIRNRVDMSLQLASPIISLDLNSQGIVQKIAENCLVSMIQNYLAFLLAWPSAADMPPSIHLYLQGQVYFERQVQLSKFLAGGTHTRL